MTVVGILWPEAHDLCRIDADPTSAAHIYEIMLRAGVDPYDIYFEKDGEHCSREEAFESRITISYTRNDQEYSSRVHRENINIAVNLLEKLAGIQQSELAFTRNGRLCTFEEALRK